MKLTRQKIFFMAGDGSTYDVQDLKNIMRKTKSGETPEEVAKRILNTKAELESNRLSNSIREEMNRQARKQTNLERRAKMGKDSKHFNNRGLNRPSNGLFADHFSKESVDKYLRQDFSKGTRKAPTAEAEMKLAEMIRKGTEKNSVLKRLFK